MRLSSTLFVTILSVGSLAGYSDAFGGNGNGNGGGGGLSFSRGGFTVSTGNLNRGGNLNNGGNGGGRGCNNGGGGGYNNGGGVYNGNGGGQYFGQAYEPFHSYYVVEPGDSFYTVSLKEYATSSVANNIARFNRLPSNAALVPGQKLLLPSVSANGRLTQSRAPAPVSVANNPVATADTTAKFAPVASTTTPTAEETSEPLPKLATGSVISLDGQEHGAEQGVVRIRLGSVAFPVEVLEWTANSAKVRLPKLEISEETKAVLEVLKADGTLASSNGIELTSADSNLAKN